MATATISQDSAKSTNRAGGREHAFFSGVAFLVLIAVFAGFARSYFLAGIIWAKLPSVMVHVHGALFTLWIALLVAQVALIASRQPRWHMRLGILGMCVAPLMVITGFVTLVDAIKYTLILCCFAGLISWAFLARRDPPTHKRLILFATFLIIAPAIARWPITTPARLWIFMYCFPALLVAYDLWTRRSVHRVTVCGVVLMIGLQLASPPLARSAFMSHIVARLQKS